MLVFKASLIGSAFATFTVNSYYRLNDPSCAGVTEAIIVNPDEFGIPCVSNSCFCTGNNCLSYNSCNSESVSKIGSAFGSKSYILVGNYNDTACTSLTSGVLYLADTCILSSNSSSTYASSSGEVATYSEGLCKGRKDALSALSNARTTCTRMGPNSFIKNTFMNGSTSTTTNNTSMITTATLSPSASIQPSFLSFSALFASVFILATC